MFNELFEALSKNPIITHQTEDGVGVYIWAKGEEILCESKLVIELIADLLVSVGYETVNTGYYDPEIDSRDGIQDEYTGNYFVSIN